MPTTRTETPETFRLPKPGQHDRHFGGTRTWYYDLESRGLLKLIRVTAPGRKRGIVLIPYSDVLNLVNAAKK
jgi:hypothetical protein